MNICEQANEYFRSRTGEEAPKKRPAPIGLCLAGGRASSTRTFRSRACAAMTRWRTSSRSRRPSRRAASSAAAAPARSRSSMALHVCGLANKQVNEHCVFVNGWACGAPRQTNKQNRGVWFTFVSFVREHFGKKLTLLGQDTRPP